MNSYRHPSHGAHSSSPAAETFPLPDLTSIFKMSNLSSSTQKHLVDVYSLLSFAMAVAAGGAFLHTLRLTWLTEAGFLSIVGCIAMMVCLIFVFPHVEEDRYSNPKVPAARDAYLKRISLRKKLFLAFSFFEGLGLGPLVEVAHLVHPGAVPIALVTTTLIFLSFTASALYSPRRSYLFLGAILGSVLSVLCILSLANIFYRSEAVASIGLYGGLLVFTGYLLYDTQIIVEKAEHGSSDTTGHALELFLDIINIFVRIVVILMKRQKRKNDEE